MRENWQSIGRKNISDANFVGHQYFDGLSHRKRAILSGGIQIISGCKNKRYDGIVAAHAIVDMFFILRKHFTNAERRQMLLAFFEILTIEAIDEEKLRLALKNEPFTDFEDCLQVECAKTAQVDYIITRNEKDYALSEVPILSPEQFTETFS